MNLLVPKALIERLTKWRLCMSYNDSYFGEPAGELKRIVREIEDNANAPGSDDAQPDDAAVDRFAQAMKAKMAAAREKGRGGWEQCPPDVLSRMLREHVEKGDPRDVANFCMMLWNNGASIATTSAPSVADAVGASERERFEAWLLSEGYPSERLVTRGRIYVDDHVDDLWDGWQARAKESGK